ncbi:MAG TPA: hypothetical protein VHU22_24445 [Xanthobacteraceae bacterium]|nr:hypothetical protein [Xanthobacteraceae bacterium]
MKTMLLETTDGLAILAYTGLGATARGTEPSHWMSGVLRGRSLPLEQALGVLADALRQQFPPHMRGMPRSGTAAHTVVAPAFIGHERRLYTIDLVVTGDGKERGFRYTRHQKEFSSTYVKPYPIGRGGSGAMVNLHKGWQREILSLANAHDGGKLSPHAVADRLAQLNWEVHQRDSFVGPNCIVIWRYRRGKPRKFGAAHQAYRGLDRDPTDPHIPQIAGGFDMGAFAKDAVSQMFEHFKRNGIADAGAAMSRITQEAFARMPKDPDKGPLK